MAYKRTTTRSGGTKAKTRSRVRKDGTTVTKTKTKGNGTKTKKRTVSSKGGTTSTLKTKTRSGRGVTTKTKATRGDGTMTFMGGAGPKGRRKTVEGRSSKSTTRMSPAAKRRANRG